MFSRRASRVGPALLLALLWAAVPLAAQTVGAPELTFQPDRITAAGITPGGKVAWLSVAREVREHGAPHVVPREGLVEDLDGDGTVSWEVLPEVPGRSIWGVVDVTTGRFVWAAPGDYPVRLDPFPEAAVQVDTATGATWVEQQAYRREVLVVRPGLGAWRQSLGDGDTGDLDAEGNGLLRWGPAAGAALGGDPAAPSTFAAGDLFLVIDPVWMAVSAHKIEAFEVTP